MKMDPGETFQPRNRNRPAAHLLFSQIGIPVSLFPHWRMDPTGQGQVVFNLGPDFSPETISSRLILPLNSSLISAHFFPEPRL
jgi:hypothetical protein